MSFQAIRREQALLACVLLFSIMFSRKCTHHPALNTTHSCPCSLEAPLSQCFASTQIAQLSGRSLRRWLGLSHSSLLSSASFSQGIHGAYVGSSHTAMTRGRRREVGVPLRAEGQDLEWLPRSLDYQSEGESQAMRLHRARVLVSTCPKEKDRGSSQS